MADVQTQFNEFHDKIKLEDSTIGAKLREKREIITQKIKDGIKRRFEDEGESPPKMKTFNQGSYAIKTGIHPLTSDYDIDVGLLIAISTGDYSDPTTVKTWVLEALEGHTKDVRMKEPCVTATYRENGEPAYHVDIATYADREANTSTLDALARGKQNAAKENRRWEDADPQELTKVLNERHSGNARAQYRRAIMCLKRWKDNKFADEGNQAPTGIALTLAAYNWFIPSGERQLDGDIKKPDDLDALCELTTKMLAEFQVKFENGETYRVLKLELPVAPWNNVLDSMTSAQQNRFHSRLQTLNEALLEARETVDPHAACKKLEQQFGDDFPVPERQETAEKKAKAISSHSASA